MMPSENGCSSKESVSSDGSSHSTYTSNLSLQANALEPMVFTVLGMVIFEIPVQPENADSPISVTEFGIVTEVSPVQPMYLLSVDYQCYTL